MAKKPVSKERTHFPICFSTRTFTVWSYLQAGSRRFVTPRRGILITRRLIKSAPFDRLTPLDRRCRSRPLDPTSLNSRCSRPTSPLKSLEPKAIAVEPAYDHASRAPSAAEKKLASQPRFVYDNSCVAYPHDASENRSDRLGDAARRCFVIVPHVVIGFYSIRDYLRIDRRPITSRYFCGLTLRR